MKLFVFTYNINAHNSTLHDNIQVVQWKALLNNHFAWEDGDDDVADNEMTIRREYLDANGIYVDEIGHVGPRFWWARVNTCKTAMGDFYDAGVVEAKGELAWHTFYTFSDAAGNDSISKDFDYIPSPDVKTAIRSVLAARAMASTITA